MSASGASAGHGQAVVTPEAAQLCSGAGKDAGDSILLLPYGEGTAPRLSCPPRLPNGQDHATKEH